MSLSIKVICSATFFATSFSCSCLLLNEILIYVDIPIFHLLFFINFLSRVEVSYTKVYDASTKVRLLEDLNELINGFNFS